MTDLRSERRGDVESRLREIYNRTKGHCHFCGDPVVFERRGWAPDLKGYWELDHLIQRRKGGSSEQKSLLSQGAATPTNRKRTLEPGQQGLLLVLLGYQVDH